MNATTGTTTVYSPPPDLSEMRRTIELAQARIHDTFILPPNIVSGLEKHLHRTADEITARIAGAGPTLWGMKVQVNDLLSNVPARVHKKRKTQSWAYHRRIQKKWNKRFGTGPVAILLASDVYRNPVSTTTHA